MIDIDAVNEATRNGKIVPFEQLIVFDSDRRHDCALRAWGFYCRASHDQYGYHDGLTTEEWKRIVHTISDPNPHYNTNAIHAMQTIERAR